MNSIDRNRYLCVILSALIQGLLLGVYATVRSGLLLCMPLTLIILIPFVFWLTQEHWGRRLRNFITGLTAVIVIFYLYRLWSLYSPNGSFYVVPSQKADLIRTSMVVFLIIPFFQCRIATWSWRMPYSEIFFQFCRNLFLLLQATLVITVFWGLLVTASLLFDIVGLGNVPYVIFNPIVAFPLTSLVIAISISVAIRYPGIDSLGRWILSVVAWLLPPFSFLSLVFISCLPFSGLQTLWSTGQASTLMLLLQFGTIILANAAWLDGTKKAFSNKYINIAAQIALLCLPVYTALCLYSVGLRVEQYGLSTDRVQAVFLVVVTGVFGIGYAGAVLLRKWPGAIGNVNIASALIMTIIIAAMNSPILDPYRLAAYNQADRLSGGKISAEDFDYIYTRFNLGRYGNHVLTRMSEEGPDNVKRGIAAAMAIDPAEYLNYIENNVPPLSRRREILADAKVYPQGRKLSDELINYFIDEWEEESSILRGANRPSDIAFVYLDVEFGNDSKDLILMLNNVGMIFDVSRSSPVPIGMINGEFELDEVSFQDISTVEPRFMDLKIKNGRYQILPVDLM